MRHTIGHTAHGGPVTLTIDLRDTTEGRVVAFTADARRTARSRDIYTGGQALDIDREVATWAPGWSPARYARVRALWERWHLNGMRAGCEHQRAGVDHGDGDVRPWNERPIDPSQPLNAHNGRTWNMLAWVRRDEHPAGLLSFPCPVCGYRYGTAWLYEAIPQEVVDELVALG